MHSRLGFKSVDMTSGPLLKNVILFAIPVIITTLLQYFFNAADMIVVGRFCGSDAVASIGAATPVCNLVVNLFVGFASGVGIITAISAGAEDREECSKIVHTAVPAAIICGVVINICLFIFSTDLLLILKTPENVIKNSDIYMKIYSFGMLPSMLYNFCSSIVRAKGDTVRPLIYLFISGITNVMLNLIFVLVFDMGVAGVAIATTISNTLSAVLVIINLLNRQDECRLNVKEMHLHLNPLKKIMKIGVPLAFQSILVNIANISIQGIANTFGSQAVAGASAATSVEAFIGPGITGFTQAALNFTGQNFGAENYGRIKKIFKTCLICVLTFTAFLVIVMILLSKQVISLYITDSPVALSFGERKMFVSMPGFMLLAVLNIADASVRGMGKTIVPTTVAVIGNFGIRTLWLLTAYEMLKTTSFAWEILYLAYPVYWLISAAALCIIYKVTISKYIKAKKMP